MKQYYYYNMIRKTTIQFLNMLNDIRIARFDNNGNIVKYVTVPLIYGTKEKAAFIGRRNSLGSQEESLPLLEVSIGAIEYNSTRLPNKHESITVSKNLSQLAMLQYLNPTPYDIHYVLNFWVLHLVDVDQILEQILPYFSPQAYVKLYIHELDTTLDLKVLLQDYTPQISDEMTEEDNRVIRLSLAFVVQTWLFKPAESIKLINNVDNMNINIVNTFEDYL